MNVYSGVENDVLIDFGNLVDRYIENNKEEDKKELKQKIREISILVITDKIIKLTERVKNNDPNKERILEVINFINNELKNSNEEAIEHIKNNPPLGIPRK